MQFGPTMRIRYGSRLPSSLARQRSFSSRAPAPDPGPALTMTQARVPFSPSSRRIPGTVGAGVMITARSGGDRISETERHTGRPWISPPLRLTRWISPLKPPASRLRVTAAPTAPGRSVAPIATTDFGAINLSRLRVDMVTDHHGLRRHRHDSEPGAKQAQHDDAACAS